MNAVEEWKSQELKQIGDVSTFRRFILEALREADVIELDDNKGDLCLMHPEVSHDVETCLIVEDLLQELISRGQIEICSAKKEQSTMFMQIMVSATTHSNIPNGHNHVTQWFP